MRDLIAGVALALCAIVALAGVSARFPVVGSEAIHWQTDRVDLRAEGLTLELEGQVFSPDGVEVTIAEGASGQRRWYTDVRWSAGEHRHALVLNFRHSIDEWYVDQVIWRVEGPMPSGLDGRYGSGAFRLSRVTRTPLGQVFSGDIRRSGNGNLAACENEQLSLVDTFANGAELVIDELRLAVAPRQPTLIERALRRLGFTRKLDQSLSLLAPECSGHGEVVALPGALDGGSGASH